MLLMLFVPMGSAVVVEPPDDTLPPIPDVVRTNYTGTRSISAPWDFARLHGTCVRGRRLY